MEPHKNIPTSWVNTLILAASLIIAQGSIAVFGKDNILQMIAEVVAQEVIKQQGGTCQLPGM